MPKVSGSTYDEEDFAEMNKRAGYRDSKILEEEMLRDFSNS